MERLSKLLGSNLWIIGLVSLVVGIAVGYLIRAGQGF